MEAYTSSIWAFGFNFNPRGWMKCDGQSLPITSYTALFSLLGTTFGGNGITTFALPDLRGRTPIGAGQGPGLSDYVLGQVSGSENATLLASNLPSHTHPAISVAIPVSEGTDSGDPSGNYFGVADSGFDAAYETSGGVPMATNTGNTNISGSNTPFNIQDPFLVINYCICVDGFFPARN